MGELRIKKIMHYLYSLIFSTKIYSESYVLLIHLVQL